MVNTKYGSWNCLPFLLSLNALLKSHTGLQPAVVWCVNATSMLVRWPGVRILIRLSYCCGEVGTSRSGNPTRVSTHTCFGPTLARNGSAGRHRALPPSPQGLRCPRPIAALSSRRRPCNWGTNRAPPIPPGRGSVTLHLPSTNRHRMEPWSKQPHRCCSWKVCATFGKWRDLQPKNKGVERQLWHRWGRKTNTR